ncbi:MAG: alpha-ketoacid dehydrogenase subunit beta [Gammaproteobacteria bacterium]|nr:alpha-ketoacid dehydrogenase subunit beta [Gammaproteobacteria bacterium]MDH5801335.1 alpha-ketoacid dehydrogenase subunit beta [Gammaproteobacteria bacterium]
MSSRILSQAEAIREALVVTMQEDSSVIVLGEGVPDPRGIFGTTLGLKDQFGPDRVFDSPLSENGVTGVCIGAALAGFKPVLVHQRIEFALLSMDQLINNAAKWNYMFNGENTVPMVVRMIIGRGWGQGPQHSQSLQTLFAHIPGLKVVMPVSAYDAKGMLISAIQDNNPVIFIEHRWLHSTTGEVPEGLYTVPLDQAKIVRQGEHITVAAFSYMVLEALAAASELKKLGIEVEVVDMRSVRPMDIGPVCESIKRTGKLIVADTGHTTNGIASELIAQVCESSFLYLSHTPVRIASPDYPVPTSHFIANDYYPEAADIAVACLKVLGKDEPGNIEHLENTLYREAARDVPNVQFRGPF